MISINAGQCGNQLGFCVLDSLFDHLSQPTLSSRDQDQQEILKRHFFRRTRNSRSGSSSSSKTKWIARSVCIDTEPKVIHDCVSRAEEMKKWFFNSRNTHYEHGGAGNNWAKGYQLCTGEFRDASINSIRMELEDSDVSPTLMIVHSVGGGTGSGLGTKMAEDIYDEFPDVSKMNLAVMPYHFGEVVVQHYNSVLCLAKIAQVSDAILLYENEFAHELCVNMRGISRPTLYDINRAITSQIIPALVPKVMASSPLTTRNAERRYVQIDALLASRACSPRSHLLSQDIAHLCSHSNFKFLNIKTTPQTSTASVSFTYDSWSTIISSLQRMSDSGSYVDRKSCCKTASASHLHADATQTVEKLKVASSGQFFSNSRSSALVKNVATSLILRGPDAAEAAHQVHCVNETSAIKCGEMNRHDPNIGGGLTFSMTQPIWANNRCDANSTVLYSDHMINGYQRSACLLSNGQSILPSLQRPMTKGANMFRSGAYVHQYESCGLETEEFVSAFRGLGSIINEYVNM